MKGERASRIGIGEKRDRNGGKETTSECCLKVYEKIKFLEILCGNCRPLVGVVVLYVNVDIHDTWM